MGSWESLKAGIPGAGAGVGTALAVNATGVALGTPEEIVTVPVGALTGMWGGINGYNDALMSFQQSMMNELAERDMEFNSENIRVLLNDEDFFKSARNEALQGGAIIATTEALFTFGGGKLASKIVRPGPVVKGNTFVPSLTTIKKGGVFPIESSTIGDTKSKNSRPNLNNKLFSTFFLTNVW